MRFFQKTICRPGSLFAWDILLILFFVLYPGTARPEASELQISFHGLHKFRPGDNLEWASPGYDDSHWKTIRVPGSWQSQGLRPKKGMGWYRIHFTVPETMKRMNLGLSPGIIGNADETFLNGVRIGGKGVLGERFIEAAMLERLYRIPKGLLRFNKPNILAVRVMNTFSQGGILEGDIGIGDYSKLYVQKITRDFGKKAAEIGIFAVFLTFFLACVLVYFAGIREEEYIYFGIVILIFLSLYALESFLFYDSGLKTSASQGILAGLSGLLPLSILYFLAAFLKFEFNLPIKIIILYSLLVSALLLFFGNYNYDAFTFLSLLWVISLLSISAAGLYISIRAYQDKRLESGPIVLGVMALALGALFETINILDFIRIKVPFNTYYLFVFFSMCVLYALVIRFIRFRNIARTLSGRILTAHENERKRLAREIHDGLGQRFMAVMFNLQRINRTLKDNRVTDVIQEVSGSIDELRDISRGLRPSLLDEMGLFAAVQSFCKSFSKKTGLPVRVAGDPGVKLPTPVEENLFRILQESLNNVVKHADAGNAEVILKHSDRNIRLRIEDDGKGFDYYKALSDGKGVGLSTMKERVDLIEGSLDIRSRPGKGTVIKVEVPLR